MKIALIANLRPDGRRRKRSIADLEERLASSKIQFETFPTQYHGHAFDIVKGLDVREYDAVVSYGGDGTNYQVLNGLLKYHGEGDMPPMGIIPVGRGNSFAKDLEIFSIEDGLSALDRRRTREVDVCSFTQGGETHYFINLMGFGFVTDVAKTAFRFRKTGDFSYIIGVLYRTIGLSFHEMVLEIDGKVISGKNCFVEFCNSRYTGGDMLIAPDAKIDDGYFDAVILSPLSRTSLMSTFPKIFKGTHGENPATQFVKGKTAKIVTGPAKDLLPDGEFFGRTPTEIKVLPRYVRYFC
jgi:diacylglycerol kinase (ATP)